MAAATAGIRGMKGTREREREIKAGWRRGEDKGGPAAAGVRYACASAHQVVEEVEEEDSRVV